MKTILIILLTTLIYACNNTASYEGILIKTYLDKDTEYFAIKTTDSMIVFKGDYKNIDENLLGETIIVKGELKERRLPMFILPDNEMEVVPQGIAMPTGTNIDNESRYYIINKPIWQQKK
jgi:hypothetical protein